MEGIGGYLSGSVDFSHVYECQLACGERSNLNVEEAFRLTVESVLGDERSDTD